MKPQSSTVSGSDASWEVQRKWTISIVSSLRHALVIVHWVDVQCQLMLSLHWSIWSRTARHPRFLMLPLSTRVVKRSRGISANGLQSLCTLALGIRRGRQAGLAQVRTTNPTQYTTRVPIAKDMMSCRRLNALLLLLPTAWKLFSIVRLGRFRHALLLLDLARREAIGLLSERMLVAQPMKGSVGGRIDCL
jgi:hypothetical protein